MLLNSQVKTPDCKVKNGNGGHRRRHHPRMRNGSSVAAMKAFHAAWSYLNGTYRGKPWTLAMAAMACGTNVPYLENMLVLFASENFALLDRVLAGEVSTPKAARMVKRVSKLVKAFRNASAADRVAFANTIGPGDLFDTTLVPAL